MIQFDVAASVFSAFATDEDADIVAARRAADALAIADDTARDNERRAMCACMGIAIIDDGQRSTD